MFPLGFYALISTGNGVNCQTASPWVLMGRVTAALSSALKKSEL